MTAQAALPLHALRSPTLRRIDGVALIACSASKCPVPAPARHLYTGQLFRASVRYAEAAGVVAAADAVVRRQERTELNVLTLRR